MKKLLLYSFFAFPIITGAQNLLQEFESATLTTTPSINTWGVNILDVFSIVDNGINTSDKFVQMASANTDRDLPTASLFKQV